MMWYENMPESEKKQFWTVVAVSGIGSILILLVPVICRFVF